MFIEALSTTTVISIQSSSFTEIVAMKDGGLFYFKNFRSAQ